MSLDLYTLFGVVGSILVIVAYFATQQGWLRAEDWRFPATNLIGAVFILLSLYADWNLPAFVIEVFWLFISFYGLMRSLRRS